MHRRFETERVCKLNLMSSSMSQSKVVYDFIICILLLVFVYLQFKMLRLNK